MLLNFSTGSTAIDVDKTTKKMVKYNTRSQSKNKDNSKSDDLTNNDTTTHSKNNRKYTPKSRNQGRNHSSGRNSHDRASRGRGRSTGRSTGKSGRFVGRGSRNRRGGRVGRGGRGLSSGDNNDMNKDLKPSNSTSIPTTPSPEIANAAQAHTSNNISADSKSLNKLAKDTNKQINGCTPLEKLNEEINEEIKKIEEKLSSPEIEIESTIISQSRSVEKAKDTLDRMFNGSASLLHSPIPISQEDNSEEGYRDSSCNIKKNLFPDNDHIKSANNTVMAKDEWDTCTEDGSVHNSSLVNTSTESPDHLIGGEATPDQLKNCDNELVDTPPDLCKKQEVESSQSLQVSEKTQTLISDTKPQLLKSPSEELKESSESTSHDKKKNSNKKKISFKKDDSQSKLANFGFNKDADNLSKSTNAKDTEKIPTKK